jgi:hypothetical protein
MNATAIRTVTIHVIPPAAMRYATVGDWQLRQEGRGLALKISVADSGAWRTDLLVALHELVEAVLCHDAGITAAQVDAWDNGPGKAMDDPGESPQAPYHRQHMFAEALERRVAEQLGVRWADHELLIDAIAAQVEIGVRTRMARIQQEATQARSGEGGEP